MTATKANGRDLVKRRMCGWCAGAARGREPRQHHRRCPGNCACGNLDHKFDRNLAEAMARYTHLTIDEVYEAHGRKRRTLTPEQRQAAIERLTSARHARAAS